jgi:hypothetical protein
MKSRIQLLGIIALVLTASSAAYANVHLNVDLNPFGWGAPPPVVYEPRRYYAPPVVYNGRGHWGDQRDSRARHPDHDRSEQHNEGDGRH